MKFPHLLAFISIFFLFACQPAALPTVTIMDGPSGQIITLQTNERLPSELLDQAALALHPNDLVLLNGLPVARDRPINHEPITLQIRRAVSITISTPDGTQQLQSSAFTVGEALQETSFGLHAGDKVKPALNTPITGGMTITVTAPLALTVSVDGNALQVPSSARTVGEALAQAGIPLIGLDYSLPAENEALPPDGQIRAVRVNESVVLAQKPIPFESESQASADVPLDQTQIIQPGENGLTVQRIRIRHEDGKEISRLTEDETMVRPPRTRILAYGTKIEIKTAVVDGVNIEYWRVIQMYATSYSPCRSGVANCGSTTASGKTVRQGLIGVRLNWYLSMRGQQFFIPGYGRASIEDVCGGCVGKPWVDLGYSDSDYQQWNSWVTVYFLTPVPANVSYVLQ